MTNASVATVATAVADVQRDEPAGAADAGGKRHDPQRRDPARGSALFAPVPAGTGVEGGARARMEREDAARKAR